MKEEEYVLDKKPVGLGGIISTLDSSLLANLQKSFKANEQNTSSDKSKHKFLKQIEAQENSMLLDGTSANTCPLRSPVSPPKKKLHQIFDVMCDSMVLCQPLSAQGGSISFDGLVPTTRSEKCSLLDAECPAPGKIDAEESDNATHIVAAQAAPSAAHGRRCRAPRGNSRRSRPLELRTMDIFIQPLEGGSGLTSIDAEESGLKPSELRRTKKLAHPLDGGSALTSIDAEYFNARTARAAHFKSLQSRTKGNLALLQMYHKRKEAEVPLLEKYRLS